MTEFEFAAAGHIFTLHRVHVDATGTVTVTALRERDGICVDVLCTAGTRGLVLPQQQATALTLAVAHAVAPLLTLDRVRRMLTDDADHFEAAGRDEAAFGALARLYAERGRRARLYATVYGLDDPSARAGALAALATGFTGTPGDLVAAATAAGRAPAQQP